MVRIAKAVTVAMVLALGGTPAHAVDRLLLGKRILVRDPTGLEGNRAVIGLGREIGSDIPNISDPTAGGGTLRVHALGGTSSDQTYTLPASGWRAVGSVGFTYDATGAAPVKRVTARRTPAGTAVIKVILNGTAGSDALDVIPPNPGDSAGFVLEIAGGDRYCVALGGPAGGTEVKDDARQYKVINATMEPGCPPPPTTPTSTTTTTTTTTTGATTTTTTTTLPTTDCCQFPPGPFFPQALPACLDTTSAHSVAKCGLLGGLLVPSPAVCDPLAEVCVLAPVLPHEGCCQCPVSAPPFPNPSFCFNTMFAHVAAKCGPPCAFMPGFSCTPVTEVCAP